MVNNPLLRPAICHGGTLHGGPAWPAMKHLTHQEFQAPKMEVLNLIKAILVGFPLEKPYIQLI